MPKQRTRKAAAKRFKITKGGKVLHRSNEMRHLRSNKSKNRIRRMKTEKPVEGVFKKRVKQMLGRA